MLNELLIRLAVSVGRSTRYLMGSTTKDSPARTGSSRGLMCSIVNRTIEAMIAMNRRVWMDGPSANNSFISGTLVLIMGSQNKPEKVYSAQQKAESTLAFLTRYCSHIGY